MRRPNLGRSETPAFEVRAPLPFPYLLPSANGATDRFCTGTFWVYLLSTGPRPVLYMYVANIKRTELIYTTYSRP
jgi:hypothetical protein